MKTVFPFGSTALMLMFLSLVAAVKGRFFTREGVQAVVAVTRADKPIPENPEMVAAASQALKVGHLWGNGAMLLMLLSMVFAILWFRQRLLIRQRRAMAAAQRDPFSASAPSRLLPRQIRRTRRR